MTKLIVTEVRCTWWSLSTDRRHQIRTAVQMGTGALVWAASIYSLLF